MKDFSWQLPSCLMKGKTNWPSPWRKVVGRLKKIEPVCWWAVISFKKTQWKFSVEFLCHFFTFGNWRVVKKVCRPSSVETLKLYVYPYFLFYLTFILFQNFMDECIVIMCMCVCLHDWPYSGKNTVWGSLWTPPSPCAVLEVIQTV